MSIQQTLLKARQHVQLGRYVSATQIYRGLLRLTPDQPQVNGLLGSLLIQMGQPQKAVEPLEIAFAQQPENPEHWVNLLIAHHRGGDIHRARELLEKGAEMGVPQERLLVFRKDLSEPPEGRLKALIKLVESGNGLDAKIAAYMLVADYPDSATACDLLARVLAMKALNAN